MRGFAAYQVEPAVTSHEAWGLGSYCFFNKNPAIVADHAFEGSVTANVLFHNMVTVSLGGECAEARGWTVGQAMFHFTTEYQ